MSTTADGRPAPEGLISDLISLGGAGAEVVEIDPRGGLALGPLSGAVRIGVHRRGPRPKTGLDAFDILLTADAVAPSPWVGRPDLEAALSELLGQIDRRPAAAAVAAQVLRASLSLDFEAALVQESLAYSLLLASAEFSAWRSSNPARERPQAADHRVTVAEDDGVLVIRLDRPGSRNAFDAAMRDALVEALAFALDHPDAPPVMLGAAGPAFSAGGDLDEFGRAGDPALAHLVRTLRSPARLVHRLGPRLTARLHGACVGAGIEVPAAAHRVVAERGASFRLPEVSMGLIPGAGGTATIPRRIGRNRTCYLAISGARLELAEAIAWGLVDAEANP